MGRCGSPVWQCAAIVGASGLTWITLAVAGSVGVWREGRGGLATVLAAAVALPPLKPLLDFLRRHHAAVQVVTGLLIVAIGVLIYFNAFARLQNEVDVARSALEERKVIDRAKGVLMKAKNLTEEEAYARMRRSAMNENKKIAEIAQSILTAAEMLK